MKLITIELLNEYLIFCVSEDGKPHIVDIETAKTIKSDWKVWRVPPDLSRVRYLKQYDGGSHYCPEIIEVDLEKYGWLGRFVFVYVMIPDKNIVVYQDNSFRDVSET